MPDSIVTQDTQGQELDNSISSFFLQFHIGRPFANAMQPKKKDSQSQNSSSTSSAMLFRRAACTCSRRPEPSGNVFPRIHTTGS